MKPVSYAASRRVSVVSSTTRLQDDFLRHVNTCESTPASFCVTTEDTLSTCQQQATKLPTPMCSKGRCLDFPDTFRRRSIDFFSRLLASIAAQHHPPRVVPSPSLYTRSPDGRRFVSFSVCLSRSCDQSADSSKATNRGRNCRCGRLFYRKSKSRFFF